MTLQRLLTFVLCVCELGGGLTTPTQVEQRVAFSTWSDAFMLPRWLAWHSTTNSGNISLNF